MNFLSLAKVGKALFLFIKEMWLRDRTFRQFLHENLTLVVITFGFVIMTVMFLHVYYIVLDQEKTIKDYEVRYANLQEDYEEDIPVLKERMEWYRDRYLELTAAPSNPPVSPSPTPQTPVPKPIPKRPNPIANEDELFERWNRLAE